MSLIGWFANSRPSVMCGEQVSLVNLNKIIIVYNPVLSTVFSRHFSKRGRIDQKAHSRPHKRICLEHALSDMGLL